MAEFALSTGYDPLRPFRIPNLPPTFYYIPNFITAEEEASILQKAWYKSLFYIPAQRWVTLSHRRLQTHPSRLTPNNILLAAPLPSYLVNPIVERFKIIGVFKNTLHKMPNHVLINEYKRGEGIMPHEDGSAYADVVATVSLGASLCLEISPKPDNEEHSNTQSHKGGTPIDDMSSTGKELGLSGSDRTEDEYDINTMPSPPSTSQYTIPTRILQEPRSLLITTGSAYKDLLHGIAPIDVDENLSPDTVANWHLLAEPYVFEQAGGRNERATRVSLTYRDVLKVSSAASKVFGGLGKR